MQAYRVETVVEPDGSLTVHDLPFVKGEKVEVIILSNSITRAQQTSGASHPLRGLPIVYQDPFEPVVPE